ncbi:putative deferrochelatase/peroxidase YfeX [Marinomonas aquimarina]|uniref:Putative deferrochelatase/peroxidase YfeX n=1 Tax=Marinomonas aquimarina TaxID=295068 RepID=A0A1A8TEG9_9GAMM|nr:Dyp-type peroxidase [Marinomonas aquimarina]SBS30226.1 putative deferrochelatase/peroxidase YfeX [Marinomonas aquimarina]
MSSNHQSGITAEASSDATFILLDAVPEKEAQLRQALAAFPELIRSIQQQFPDAQLHAAIGFSCHSFTRITEQSAPKELAPFPSFSGQYLSVTDAPYDILMHIRAHLHDATHILALSLFKALADTVTLREQTNGFKYLDNRDFTGFVDGTENPQGDERPAVALVGTEDPDFQGGSYLNYMKFVHDLEHWEHQALQTQEDTYGRTKYDNEEYPSAEKSPHAHTKRTSLKDEHGKSLEILRQSMPFGDLQQQGLVFVSYSKTPMIFDLMLKSMIEGDEQGRADHLMQYTHATSGSTFFVPTLSFLTQLA